MRMGQQDQVCSDALITLLAIIEKFLVKNMHCVYC